MAYQITSKTYGEYPYVEAGAQWSSYCYVMLQYLILLGGETNHAEANGA